MISVNFAGVYYNLTTVKLSIPDVLRREVSPKVPSFSPSSPHYLLIHEKFRKSFLTTQFSRNRLWLKFLFLV